jgi:hypothetical protein
MATYPTSNFLFRLHDQNGPFQIMAVDGAGFMRLFAAKCLALWDKSAGQRASDRYPSIIVTHGELAATAPNFR